MKERIKTENNKYFMTEKYRKTEISFSFLIHQLYGGQDYRIIKSYNDPLSAKKYYLKIIKSIRFSIEETISITDNNHKEELLQTIDRFKTRIKSARTFEQLDQLMITFQSEIIFRLIGFLPNRRRTDKVINSRGNWKLDNYRQIQYIQTNEQKKNLIFKAVQGKYKERFGEWVTFVKKIYSRQCDNKSDKLIEWLRKHHSDIYIDLF